MQERRRKIEATFLNKIGSYCTPWYIDGLIHSVFARSQYLFQFNDSDTQIHTIYYQITEVHPVLIHWWVVYAIFLPWWITACFITFSSQNQHFQNAELQSIRTHCWDIPFLNTLLNNSQFQNIVEVYPILINLWAIPTLKTLLSYTQS